MKKDFEKKIARVIHSSLQHAESIEEEAYILSALVKILSEKKALNSSDRIIGALKEILDKEQHILTAVVTVAQPLSEEILNSLANTLKERYTAQSVVIKEHIDTSIIGGMKVTIGEEEYDTTIKGKINKLAQHLQVIR